MRWLLHGPMSAAVADALQRHDHSAVGLVEAGLSPAADPMNVLDVARKAQLDVLTTDDAGRAIPRPVGTALKLPLVLIDTDGSTYWDFALCEYSGTAPTVLTVYRDGRIVDAAEYSTLDKAP